MNFLLLRKSTFHHSHLLVLSLIFQDLKKLLPLLAVAAATAACTDYGDHDHDNHRHHAVAPAAVVTPAPAYVAPGYVVEERGHQHKHSEDALSDRSLGATRGSHNQPMTHKDFDNDGNYDYQPEYRYRVRSPAYYYSY